MKKCFLFLIFLFMVISTISVINNCSSDNRIKVTRINKCRKNKSDFLQHSNVCDDEEDYGNIDEDIDFDNFKIWLMSQYFFCVNFIFPRRKFSGLHNKVINSMRNTITYIQQSDGFKDMITSF